MIFGMSHESMCYFANTQQTPRILNGFCIGNRYLLMFTEMTKTLKVGILPYDSKRVVRVDGVTKWRRSFIIGIYNDSGLTIVHPLRCTHDLFMFCFQVVSMKFMRIHVIYIPVFSRVVFGNFAIALQCQWSYPEWYRYKQSVPNINEWRRLLVCLMYRQRDGFQPLKTQFC